MPIISQCPVTESLPADASAIRPTAPTADSFHGIAPIAATRFKPEGAKRRKAQRHLLRDVAEGVAALVAVGDGIGQLADADAVEHDDDGAGEGGVTGWW